MEEEGGNAVPYDPLRSLRFVAFGIGSEHSRSDQKLLYTFYLYTDQISCSLDL